MITRETMDHFTVAFQHFVGKVPDVLEDMMATVAALEAAQKEVLDLKRTLDLMNITNQDLRANAGRLDARVGELLRDNARLEHLLGSIVQAARQAQPVQDAIAHLRQDTDGALALR